MWELAFYNCARRRNKSMLTIVVSMLVTMVFVIFVSVSFIAQSGMKLSADRMGADVIIIPGDTEISSQEMLFTGIAQMKYFDETEVYDRLPHRDIEQISPQFFLKTLPDAGCCSTSKELRIVGIDPQTDFLLQPWLKQHHRGPLTRQSAVVGANIGREFGSKTFLLNYLFEISGLLYPTGTGMDDSIFIDINQAREMGIRSFGVSAFQNRNIDHLVTSYLIKLKPGVNPERFINTVDRLNLPVHVVSIDRARAQIKEEIQNGFSILFYILGAFILICTAALVAQFNALTSSRRREIGYLRSIGFKERNVIQMVMAEVILLGGSGGLLGGIIGISLVPAFINKLQSIIIIPAGEWSPGIALMFIMGGVLFSLMVSLVAALVPAVTSARLKPHEAISGGAL